MCGICGFVGPGEKADLKRMTRSLSHRGPDAEGLHVDHDHPIYLGHRRLSVIDLDGGAQPMHTSDGELSVVFNGEIYNFQELREILESQGHHFQTDHSDTEVLLHGYRAWGAELPNHLNGMFAFVIIDRKQGQLFAARDHFGKKPFYYVSRSDLFAFASESTALTHHQLVEEKTNDWALIKLFAYGFIPAPHSRLEGVYQLPAGGWLKLDLQRLVLEQGQYWSYRLQPDDSLLSRPESELSDELLALLTQAVDRRMVTDVPLGFFLSGGIDSSAILAMAASLRSGAQQGKLQSFSIGFEEPSYDETIHAQAMASHIGNIHHEKKLSLEVAKDALERLMTQMDEPLGDPSLLPTWLLSGFARDKVTVALSGDGADELFAGYDPFAALGPARLYQRLVPGPLHSLLRRVVARMPISHSNMSLDFKLRHFLKGLNHPPSLWNPCWMAPLDMVELSALFGRRLQAEEVYSEALKVWEESDVTHPVDRSIEYFSNLYLPYNILMKVDRASMLHGLEVRSPFLDRDLVQFTMTLPRRFKFNGGQHKVLLKRALAKHLPREILQRRKKGFGIPFSSWAREMFAELPDKGVGGMDRQMARAYSEAHRQGEADHRYFLWNWLACQWLG